MNNYLDRIKILVGKENINLLKNKTVLVCGIGGVGSFVCEGLARSGVGNLILCDFDVIEETNLNRQLMTTKNNIGKYKTDVMKQRLLEISDCNVKIINKFIDSDFELMDCDYVVDCIDTLESKFELIKKAHLKNIPIISSLGSAKRIECTNIIRTSLSKTRNDPLAKALRTLVKKNNYNKKIDVVFVDNNPIKVKELGSSIFTVGSVGLFIAKEIYKDLIK